MKYKQIVYITLISLLLLLPQTAIAQSSGKMLEREYSWSYGSKVWTYKQQIPAEAYNYYKSLKRPSTNDYSIYVTDAVDDHFISNLAKKFLDVAKQEGYSKNETVKLVISFIQSLKYVTDDVSKGYDEYPRYPLETLVDQKGDCEDTSILLASILKEMNYGVVLITLPNHMAVGILGDNSLPGSYYSYQGKRYYYVETTGSGWGIGQLPKEYQNQRVQILPLIPKPVITHEWRSKGTANGLIEVKVTVNNDGTATAKGTHIYAALDAGGNRVYDQTTTKSLDLQPKSKGVYTLYLKPSPHVTTRLIVKVISNDYLVDESKSNYVKT